MCFFLSFFLNPLLFPHIAQRADRIALCDALRQLQLAAIGLANAVIAAHGDIAQQGDLFILAALLLPSLDQRAIVKINRQQVVRAFLDVHFKHPLRRLGKQRFAQLLQALRAALFHKARTLIQAAALHCSGAEILSRQASPTRLVAQ